MDVWGERLKKKSYPIFIYQLLVSISLALVITLTLPYAEMEDFLMFAVVLFVISLPISLAACFGKIIAFFFCLLGYVSAFIAMIFVWSLSIPMSDLEGINLFLAVISISYGLGIGIEAIVQIIRYYKNKKNKF